ncbi:MAG: hypothetical protein NVSMB38_10220 [Ktedonobacteraceae bacterium]
MGIYLGQLPPAEVARLKAELAETIIANFCYPRFFDYRTDSLRMRPVDRAKRQEVWLYLSSVDFTSWNRIDLMSPDFQRSIERLFIQFVQRNRSFFGEQGRKRMSDIRMLIPSTSTTIVQGLRNHITGQRQDRQGIPPFGSPRQTISWSVTGKGRSDTAWEQIAATTLLLQQQLQEMRGEVKVSQPNDSVPATSSSPRRTSRVSSSRVAQEPLQPASTSTTQKNTHITTSPLPGTKSTTPLHPASVPNAAPHRSSTSSAPAASVVSPTPAPVRKKEVAPPVTPLVDMPQVSTPMPTKSTEPVGVSHLTEQAQISASAATLPSASPIPLAPAEDVRSLAQTAAPTAPVVVASTTTSKHESRAGAMMQVGDDDIAIFEQMRHQLILWLRVEALHAGLELADQSPPQLLEMLRHQERLDETHLQVVSTLLNLSNQVIKNGRVSVLDYKQALMFHLMHTRR